MEFVVIKIDVPYSVPRLKQTLVIWVASGWIWIQERTPRKHVLEEIGLRAQNTLIVLDTIVSIMGGGVIWLFYNSKSLHFDNEEKIHGSTKYYEESSRMHKLELLVISL